MAFESQLQPMTGLMSTSIVDPMEQTIIDRAAPWTVNVNWEIHGMAAREISNPKQWHVKLLLESIGRGFEDTLADQVVPAGPYGLFDRTYTVPVTLPAANTIGVDAGAYKLTTVITLEHQGIPVAVALYEEGPVLHFYDTP